MCRRRGSLCLTGDVPVGRSNAGTGSQEGDRRDRRLEFGARRAPPLVLEPLGGYLSHALGTMPWMRRPPSDSEPHSCASR
jgi:hypothetical protein